MRVCILFVTLGALVHAWDTRSIVCVFVCMHPFYLCESVHNRVVLVFSVTTDSVGPCTRCPKCLCVVPVGG